MVSDCPFDAYAPLPLKELAGKIDQNWIISGHCRSQLKKLLIDFRNRCEDVKFYFHACDALAFCYQDSPLKFDVIDTSNVADYVGVANLLNAASRKLLSDRSVLFTESMLWTNVAPDVALYVQEVLCCPPSLTPTIYGVRLMDDVELGPTKLRLLRPYFFPPIRLRWKKTLPFDGVPLIVSPDLVNSLSRLRDECFGMTTSKPAPIWTSPGVTRSGIGYYSPLTFCYVLGDMICRGAMPGPSALISSSFAGLPPVFRNSLQTIQAWMEHRPIYLVKISFPFGSAEQSMYEKMASWCHPNLRLILVPTPEFVANITKKNAKQSALFQKDMNSTSKHFIDNIALKITTTSSGVMDQIEISFLLEDCKLLQDICGLVVDVENHTPLFFINGLDNPRMIFNRVSQPYPWDLVKPLAVAADTPRLTAMSCLESEKDYAVHFKVLCKDQTSLRGI